MGELAGYKVGQVVDVPHDELGRISGTIRWVGSDEFAAGNWLGLELEIPEGKNDGEVKGKRYFRCLPNHGLMVKPEKVVRSQQQPAAAQKTTTTAAKRTSMVGSASNSTKNAVAGAAAKTRPMSLVNPASKRQSLLDPTSKRQSINAASPTPAARGTTTGMARGLPSPTKPTARPAGSRPSSIVGAPKMAPPAARPAASTLAAKRTSIGGRPSMAPTAGPGAARPARASTTATATGASRPGALGSTRPANRLSSLQGPTSRRTSSISSITEGKERDIAAQEDDEAEEQAEHGLDGSSPTSRKISNGEKALLSPPANSREPTSPVLSRPTTQQLSAQNRKIDDLETKLRVMEKQRTEDKDRLKDLERLSGERDRFESLIQKLQAKIQPQSQEIVQLRKDLKEMEERATTAEEAQGGMDEVFEEATLDREMAEELAETYKIELDTLRKNFEEMKLEVEILRVENEDLGREMTPEERDSIGFAQLQRENERYREALIRLRDITQDTEADLNSQIRELQEEVQELSPFKSRAEETHEQLEQSETLVEELKQQLETAQGADEMIEELTEKNMSLTEQIEELKATIEDLESLKEINDELELNHVEHEKAMQEDIDYRDALLFEQARKMSEQDEIVEELEYTVSRFRELVANLNSDLEDMRSSQQITEAEANELSSRSKAMLDLNMRLQQSAAKTQIKAIDTELKRMEAQEAADHLAIVQMFLPESYAHHRDSVTAFLRFKRVAFKATMLHSFVKEKVNGMAVAGHEADMFSACDVLDKLTWIGAMCDRFVDFIVSCSLDVFFQIGNASYDLEPVERAFNGFVENLKRDELKEQQCAADLQRTMSVLEHLGERYLGDGLADYASAVHMRALMLQSHLDTGALAVAHIKSIAQARVILPTDADETDEEEAQSFLAKADNVVSQMRSAKVIAGKALHQLEELQSRSLTLEPSTQASIESTDAIVAALASTCRASGCAVAKIVNEEERMDSLTFEQVMHAIALDDATPFSSLSANITNVTAAVQSFSALTTTISQTVEFPAQQGSGLSAPSTPWALLAARVREESSATAGHEATIAQLNHQLSERNTALALKDKTVSELNVSVEVLEKRAADASKATSRARELEHQVQQAERKTRDLDGRLLRAVEDLRVLRVERETWLAAGPKPGSQDGDRALEGSDAKNVHPDFVPAKAVGEIAALKAELEVTQSVVRQLRAASTQANLSAAQSDGILESLTPKSNFSTEEREASLREKAAKDALKALRSLVARERKISLKLPELSPSERLQWRPAKDTVSWQVERRKEEWEEWKDWVGTVARDEASASKRREKKQLDAKARTASKTLARGNVLAKLTVSGLPKLDAKPFDGNITIVGSGEWDGLGRRLGLQY